MKLIILTLLVTGSIAAPLSQSLTFYDNGSYQFSYETGKDGGSHSRTESRNPDGVVVGKFSYQDPTGEIREVNYRADGTGYKAKGDVSVNGAPKGEFPLAADEQQPDSPPLSTIQVEEQAPQDPQEPQEPQETQETSSDLQQDDSDKDDIKDLTLEESTVDAPPEAFPAGFFLQQFQGLRRLPEPPKEEESTKPEPTKAEPTKSETTESSEAPADEQAVDSESKDTSTEDQPAETEPSVKGQSGGEFFVPLKPFPNFSPQQWASAMYHQPVYVFSYQQPDSFGYHYFF